MRRSPLAERVRRRIEEIEEHRSRRGRRVLTIAGALVLLGAVLPLWHRREAADGGLLERRLAATASPNVQERRQAYRALANLWLETHDEALLEHLVAGLDDPDPLVRAAVVSRLASAPPRGGAADVRLARRLVAAARRPSGGAATDVAATDDWAALLQQLETVTVAEEIQGVLYYLDSVDPSIGLPYVDWIVQQLGHPDGAVRAAAIDALVHVAPASPDLPAVVDQALASGTPDEKVAALSAVVELGLPGRTDAVADLLEDADRTVRVVASRILLALGATAKIAELEAAALLEGDCGVRVWFAYVLARMGDASFVDLLADAAAGVFPQGCTCTSTVSVQTNALILLSYLDDPRAGDLAEAVVADAAAGVVPTPRLVLPSMEILERQGRTSALASLQSLLSSPNKTFAIYAAATMHALGDADGTTALQAFMHDPDSDSIRTQAIQAASLLHDEAFRTDFETLANHPSGWTKQAAEAALARLNSINGGSGG